MELLILIGLVALIFIVAVTLVSPDDPTVRGCNDDIPCQECGECYGNHLNYNHGGHAYVYPRDLHR